jgi:hypothetical protein
VKNTSLRITLFGQVGNWRIDAKTVGCLIGSLAVAKLQLLFLYTRFKKRMKIRLVYERSGFCVENDNKTEKQERKEAW